MIVIFFPWYITSKIPYCKTFQGKVQTGCDPLKCRGHEEQEKTRETVIDQKRPRKNEGLVQHHLLNWVLGYWLIYLFCLNSYYNSYSDSEQSTSSPYCLAHFPNLALTVPNPL